LFLNTFLSQTLDSSINIANFQFPEVYGIPIILDETGENTFYLNEWNTEYITDGKIDQIRLDGSLGIPLGSYFMPKILPKSTRDDSVKNISQIYYRKGDYDYSGLGIGLQIESFDGGLFSFQGFKRSPPILYPNSDGELQNYLFTFNRKLENSNVQASILYHLENRDLPVNLLNTRRNVESFHGGLGILHSWNHLTIEAEQAYQFTFSNCWDNRVLYLTLWNQINSVYELGENIKFHFQHSYKMHSTERDARVMDKSFHKFSSLAEYGNQHYTVQGGFSTHASSLIPIGSFNWKWKNYYLSAKRNYEAVFLQDSIFKTNVKSFLTDALIIGYESARIKGAVELFNIEYENKSNLGAIGKTDINFLWIDIRHTTGVYNLASHNSFTQPINMFSYTGLIFSPNVWRWKSARYQPFIGVESFFIQHSGIMGIDPMSPAIYTLKSTDTFSSFVVNLEYGLIVNQFKVSYRWIKFNMFGNTANNSINPDSYSILPIRHLEVVWQFWN